MAQRYHYSEVDRARETLRRDGAIVLTGLKDAAKEDLGSEEGWRRLAEEIPRTLFKEKLIVKPKVAGVHLEHRELEERTQVQGFSYANAALLPHTDGYMYGDNFPDYVVLLMEAPSDHGGESFVVDGEKVLDRLKREKDGAETLQFLQTVPVDLTERSDDGIADGVESKGPVFRRDSNGRLQWRRQTTVVASGVLAKDSVRSAKRSYQSLWKPLTLDKDEAHLKVLHKLDQAVQEEGDLASRFRIASGEALIIDNFRMLHARDGFEGTQERKLWRIWVWTDESLGIPEGIGHVTSPAHDSRL